MSASLIVLLALGALVFFVPGWVSTRRSTRSRRALDDPQPRSRRAPARLRHTWDADESMLVGAAPFPALPPAPRYPNRQVSQRRVEDVKARLGALRADLVWVIEHPSLFDGDTRQSTRLFEALGRWDDESRHLSDREADEQAGVIEDRFTQARRAAELLGLDYYDEAARGEAQMAVKLVAKARSTTGPESAALMDKVAEILARLLPFDPQVAITRGEQASEPPPTDP